MTSATGICNLALRELGASTILSLDDECEEARICSLYYPQVRDMELREYFWSFAEKQAILAASTVAPAFDFTTQYPLPADFIRLIPNKHLESLNSDYKIMGGMILTNSTGPLKISYISRLEDTEKYDAMFVDTVSLRLASKICMRITQNSNRKQELIQECKESRIRAVNANALEKPIAYAQDGDFVNVRY